MTLAGGPSSLCALAAIAIAIALQISSGMYEARALALVTAAAAIAAAAAIWLRRGAPEEPGFQVQAIFGAGCAWGLACQLFVNPTFYGDVRAFAGGFRWLALAGLVLLSAYLCRHLRASLVRARFLLLLGCFAVMGVAVLRASPRPWVDVWVIQQGGAEALRHGLNPFSVSYPNIYGALTSKMLAPELFLNGRIAAYPYPPLTALVDLPALALFGDVRYAGLSLMVVGAWMLARAGGGVTGELAALFVLFQPRTFFVLEQAWTEPLLFAAFAACALALARGEGPLVAGALLGVLAASKQSSPFLVLPLAFALPAQGRRRALVTAAAIAAALLVPFALWDLRGFVRGVVLYQLWQPFRADALSLAAALAHLRPGEYPALTYAGLALGAAMLAVSLRARTHLAQAAAAAAAAWLALLLLSKQAFCNYYWLAVALLCAAAALRERKEA